MATFDREDGDLRSLQAAAAAELRLPVDAHVIGEPVTVTGVSYAGVPRVGLRATCRREERDHDVSFADVVFPAGSAGARLVANYREHLGFPPAASLHPVDTARPHKVGTDDIVIGTPIDLVVIACKSNALRCRLLGSAREVTLRTAVRDEVPGSIITVTPRKQWTHARHPYLSGTVSSIRVDASVLGLVPLPLHHEGPWTPRAGNGRGAASTAPPRPAYRMEQVGPLPQDGSDSDLLLDAQHCLEAGDYAGADDLLNQLIALDLRCLEAHRLLGARVLDVMTELALNRFEVGAAIGSLSLPEDFNGVLPWGVLDNRPFLRCLHGMARALARLGRREAAEAAFRRLLRLDPDDALSAREGLRALESGGPRREEEE